MIMETLNKAFELLKNQTGLKIRYNDKCRDSVNFDGCLEITFNNQTYKWIVELKNEITTNYLVRLQDLANNLGNDKKLLIVTAYAYPKIRERLQNMNLNFLDAAGND